MSKQQFRDSRNQPKSNNKLRSVYLWKTAELQVRPAGACGILAWASPILPPPQLPLACPNSSCTVTLPRWLWSSNLLPEGTVGSKTPTPMGVVNKINTLHREMENAHSSASLTRSSCGEEMRGPHKRNHPCLTWKLPVLWMCPSHRLTHTDP